MNKQNKSGFTLVELSIVLIIIGLITSAVTAGKYIINLSKLSNAQKLTATSPVLTTDDLVLWLETTTLNSFGGDLPDDQEGVSSLKDINPKIADKKNAVAGNEPLFVEYAINNIPALLFDGSDDYLSSGTNSDWNFLHDGSKYTYFIVFQTISDNPNSFMTPLATAYISANSVGMDLAIEDRAIEIANDRVYGAADNGTTEIYNATSADGALNLDRGNFIAVSFSGSEANIFANGNLVATDSTIGSFSNANSAVPLIIGGGNTPPGWPFAGYIGEIIIFKRDLGALERQKIEEYLSKKWEIDLD